MFSISSNQLFLKWIYLGESIDIDHMERLQANVCSVWFM